MSSPYSSYLNFWLPDEFVESYKIKTVPWGFMDAAGNSLGELTYLRSYSRLMEDGTKEHWYQTCRRVTEGTYHEQRKWCMQNRLPWSWAKANASAKEFYDRMFNMKWLPPGRGLWAMGTPFVHVNGNIGALYNCMFISTNEMTKDHPELPFVRLMESSMLGVGVGFDTDGAKKSFYIHQPKLDGVVVIEDSREGWSSAIASVLRAYLIPNIQLPIFDYSAIRLLGSPIKGFGGTAPGPEPLVKLINNLINLFDAHITEPFTTRLIVDVMNLIGVCVVSGGIRRSAELALGDPTDQLFINLKDYMKNPDRIEYGWMSNNSIKASVGMDYKPFINNIVSNGEPGFIYLDNMRRYGRLSERENSKDHRVVGTNPCGEVSLESMELCNLVEVFPTNCFNKQDFVRTLKFAYLYAKTVTLIPTLWPETNAVIQRNRRIGASVSGLAQFIESKSRTELREWMDTGYNEIQRLDTLYSEWLGVRQSIKTTSIKPSGSVSLLAGVTPGVHWPTESQYIRRILFRKDNPIVTECLKAGYTVENSVANPDFDVVIEFPIRGPKVRPEKDVSIFEKADLASLAQSFWADNQVSCTITFDRDTEAKSIPIILRMFEDRLKSISFLPIDKDAYAQMPYEAINDLIYEEKSAKLLPLDWSKLYQENQSEAEGEQFCTTDKCEISWMKNEQ